MSHASTDPALPVSTTLAHLRHRKLEATQALLGDTISIPDQDWQQPSLLPGWTRAHVATHIARNADALRLSVHGLLTHGSTMLYADQPQRRRDLERGSRRGALDLQIDLDTSAGQLNDTFDYLEQSPLDELVQLSPSLTLPAGHLFVARLNEVVLHRIDLAHGFTAMDVDADIARWLLEWNCQRLVDSQDLPPMHVLSTSGVVAVIGRAPSEEERARQVQGSDAALLGWLTHRGTAEHLLGAEDITLPV